MLDKGLASEVKYAIRKNLSKQTLRKFYSAREANRVEELFGAKTDDAIEAGLLAIYGHAVAPKREKTNMTATTLHSVRVVSGKANFASAGEVALTEAERTAVYNAPVQVWDRKKRARKDVSVTGKKRKAPAAEPKPKRKRGTCRARIVLTRTSGARAALALIRGPPAQ